MSEAQVEVQRSFIEQEKRRIHGTKKPSEKTIFFQELRDKHPDLADAVRDGCQTYRRKQSRFRA